LLTVVDSLTVISLSSASSLCLLYF